jgi:hypothetical protein
VVLAALVKAIVTAATAVERGISTSFAISIRRFRISAEPSADPGEAPRTAARPAQRIWSSRLHARTPDCLCLIAGPSPI